MTEEIDRRPPVVGTMLAAILGLFVVGLALPYSQAGVGLGAVGLALLVASLSRGWRPLADAGGLALALSVVATGAGTPAGNSPVAAAVTLGAAVAAVLAWDVATNAIGLGEQLGREADTARAEVAHFLGSLAVGFVVSTVGFGVYQGTSSGQPVTAVFFMLIAMLVLISALRL